MAIAFVNSTTGGNSSGSPVATIAAAAASHTAANCLAVSVSWYAAGVTISSVTDTAGNTYTARTRVDVPGYDDRLQIFYAYNISGNASNVVTATFSASAPYVAIAVEQYSGILTTGTPYDTEASGTDNLTTQTLTSGAFTTSQADELIYVALYAPNPTSLTAGSGYTLRENLFNGSSAGVEDKIVASIQTSVTATATTQVLVSRWAIAVATFKATVGGGGGGGGDMVMSRWHSVRR